MTEVFSVGRQQLGRVVVIIRKSKRGWWLTQVQRAIKFVLILEVRKILKAAKCFLPPDLAYQFM